MKRWIHAATTRPVEQLEPFARQAGWLDDSEEEKERISEGIEVVGHVIKELDLFIDHSSDGSGYRYDDRVVGEVDRYINSGWFSRCDTYIDCSYFVGRDSSKLSDELLILKIKSVINKTLEEYSYISEATGIDPMSCTWIILPAGSIALLPDKSQPNIFLVMTFAAYGQGKNYMYPSQRLAYRLYDSGTPFDSPVLVWWADKLKKRDIRKRAISRFESDANLMKLPDDIKEALHSFNYWIVKEKLGHTSDLDDAENYLLSRTINNKASSMSSYKDTFLPLLNDLFDYARNNGWSTSDIMDYSKKVTKYIREKNNSEN